MVENNKKVIGVLRGTFKLIHRGHVELIEKCSTLVDELYIALDSDTRNRQANKSQFMHEKDRAYILSHIVGVKKVVVFTSEEEFVAIFSENRWSNPKMMFYFKGGDYKPSEENLPELKLLKNTMSAYGISIVPVSVELTDGYSTTALVKTIKGAEC